MFDVFYLNSKPNLFPHERPASDIADARKKARTKFFWFIDGRYDYRQFNFNWLPPKWEQHQTHVIQLVSQFEQFSAIFAPTENVALVEHYYDPVFLQRATYKENWVVLNDNINQSNLLAWCPSPFDPPYIYVFGNQWYPAAEMPTVEYRIPGATECKYVDEVTATLLPNKEHWTIPEEIVTEAIDFSWVPNPNDPPYIYHFGTDFQMSVGLTYTVPGATELKFMGEPPTANQSSKIVKAVDIFFVDMNNKSAEKRFTSLQTQYPNAQRIRFINGWVETIKRCASRATTTKFWVVSSENVYDDFNFEWHAEPWQNFMLHIFGSQWQKWSDTFLISKQEFLRNARWAKKLEEFPNLHFVQDQKVYRPDDVYDIYYVDHANPGSDVQLEQIQKRYPAIKTARYVDNYLDTIKRIMSTVETDYVWIINSVCNYSKFDFTWQPEPWQGQMLHVFPSDEQKFGDTFYIYVPAFKEQMNKIALLDWFDTVNYCSDQIVPRYTPEIAVFNQDSAAEAIVSHEFTGPYAFFKSATILDDFPRFSPSLWRKKDRVVHVLSQSGSVVAVPREAKSAIKTQVYDFPYILPHPDLFVQDQPLDVVYISNGEPDAQRWYDHLISCVAKQSQSAKQKIHWVKDVPGRAAAYKEAARVSTTPWFFAVFAKLEINPEFDFTWMPDYLQEPKHYIFTAKNPVNGLEYGHQAMIAYQKQLVLDTTEHGLDFTLSKKHEVVELPSGIAHFNVDPWTTWRTSFRECVKLLAATDQASKDRLAIWTSVAQGENAEWCLNGANDAVEYFNAVDGDTDKLMLSFEWQWLNDYFTTKYHL